ncbi:hypothetical protein WR25_01113 isoform B [Diploscapter pachys]|uniref:G-protein coupled receptors family 1 profile domain-containing protein n=1 Tax=Diploscapter pachys TaxID=2018661 RepID=A0A2A2LJ81_9BILA|nr:hypothetical protein WR25_01113 isoform A [Diploscapter pachys]PAV86175.1 hypothetical protein WR25_01113 isoform B [Diploscapter pachys]
MLFYANVHGILLIASQPLHVIRSFLVKNGCDAGYAAKNCSLVLIPVFVCLVGLVATQQALWIERSLASIFLTKYETWGRMPGIILASITALISIFIPYYIFHDDTFEDTVNNCLGITHHSAEEINNLLYSFIFLNLLAVLSNCILFLCNKARERKLRFLIKERFQLFENFTTTKWVGVIVLVQFCFMTGYSTLLYLLRTKGDRSDMVKLTVMFASSYTVPYFTFLLPLLLMFSLKSVGQNRAKAINALTNEKSTDHMRVLQSTWNKANRERDKF